MRGPSSFKRGIFQCLLSGRYSLTAHAIRLKLSGFRNGWVVFLFDRLNGKYSGFYGQITAGISSDDYEINDLRTFIKRFPIFFPGMEYSEGNL